MGTLADVRANLATYAGAEWVVLDGWRGAGGRESGGAPVVRKVLPLQAPGLGDAPASVHIGERWVWWGVEEAQALMFPDSYTAATAGVGMGVSLRAGTASTVAEMPMVVLDAQTISLDGDFTALDVVWGMLGSGNVYARQLLLWAWEDETPVVRMWMARERSLVDVQVFGFGPAPEWAALPLPAARVALVGDSTGEWLAQELGVTYGGGCEMAVIDMWAGVDVTV